MSDASKHDRRDSLEELFANNAAWSRRRTAEDPGFFLRLAAQQTPRYLWVGCSDSRVPANEIAGLQAGEVFVHRNIANLVVHTDLNCLSVLQFAVEVLKVAHVMVVGHYGCAGIHAVAEHRSTGLADNWLRHVEDISFKHAALLHSLSDDAARAALLCRLNVIEQVANVCRTTIIRRAWYRGQRIEVHGLVYGLSDGLLQRAGFSVMREQSWEQQYAASLESLANGVAAS
jgi:carbonic anhydrase